VTDVHPVDGLSETQVEELFKRITEKGFEMKKSAESARPNKDIVDGKSAEAPSWWPVVH
jgi:hypothetical protein